MTFSKKRKTRRKRKSTFKKRKSAKRRKTVRKRKTRMGFKGAKGARVFKPKDKLHGAWKQAYFNALKAHPWPKKTINGAPQKEERLKIHLGDPARGNRIVTNLHCVGRTTMGSAAEAGDDFALDLTNVNDPFGSEDNNHPLYHAEWIAEGFDKVLPLACSYRFRITTLTQDDKDEFILFWRVQSDVSNLPDATINGAVATKAIQDMLASKEWFSKRFWGSANRSGGQKDFATFSVTVPNIPAHLRKVNEPFATSSGILESVFSDSTTGLAIPLRPHLQVVVFKADGLGLGNTAEFRIEMWSDHTVILWKADPTVADLVMDEHA